MSKQVNVAPFDAADYLDSEETIAEFLSVAAQDQTPGAFMLAVEAVAKARGMGEVADASGLSRESLYKALAPGAQPRFDTVRRVLQALGVQLVVVPPSAAKRAEKLDTKQRREHKARISQKTRRRSKTKARTPVSGYLSPVSDRQKQGRRSSLTGRR